MTLPLPSPAALLVKVKPGLRTPPRFMKAICAPPKSAGAVAASCESAIRSPAGMLQAASTALLGRSAVMEPITRPAIGETRLL